MVRYHAHGTDPVAGPYLVMEWVDGETLRDRQTRAALTPADALRIGARLVRALAAVHAAGVVHRDVKPRNVMLQHGSVNRVTLVDFGIARVGRSLGLTSTGARLGTPRYMAPEQIMNARRVDGRADVFSLGCVVFEMLTGRQAFHCEDDVAALARMLIEDAPSIRSLRPELPERGRRAGRSPPQQGPAPAALRRRGACCRTGAPHACLRGRRARWRTLRERSAPSSAYRRRQRRLRD